VSGYALLSGAAFAGGITQTISSAVIAIEIANVSTFHLPLLLAVMSAYAVARY
jgi:H+/Cl- antiporter ClcA